MPNNNSISLEVRILSYNPEKSLRHDSPSRFCSCYPGASNIENFWLRQRNSRKPLPELLCMTDRSGPLYPKNSVKFETGYGDERYSVFPLTRCVLIRTMLCLGVVHLLFPVLFTHQKRDGLWRCKLRDKTFGHLMMVIDRSIPPIFWKRSGKSTRQHCRSFECKICAHDSFRRKSTF